MHEDNDEYQSPLDELFERLEMREPEHIAVKYYKDYHSGSAKTLKSIQITLAARLEKFNLSSLAALTATDDLDLPSLGEKKVALFALIPDNDTSYNFLVSILYTQLFQQLFYLADHKYGGQAARPCPFPDGRVRKRSACPTTLIRSFLSCGQRSQRLHHPAESGAAKGIV